MNSRSTALHKLMESCGVADLRMSDYDIHPEEFSQMAKDAKAIYKVDKLVLVNCDIFEQYLETFRLYV